MIPILLGYVDLYETLHRFRTKKDLERAGIPGLAFKASFGIWGVWWIARSTTGLVMKDGSQMPYHQAYLTGHGPVIGPADPEAASNRPFAQAWRESVLSATAPREDDETFSTGRQ